MCVNKRCQLSGTNDRMDILTLDGSYGEGGGQTLRTALSLSALTGRPFRLTNIRAGRPSPGLLPQHLSAVRAAATISGAIVSGDRLGSTELSFSPTRSPKSGSYTFDVAEIAGRGSAGSVSLVLQTLLVPLAFADYTSTLVLRGGTHVEWSPSFDDLVNAYFPALREIGFRIDAELKRWGWYPIGNGEISCQIGNGRGAMRLNAIHISHRGALRQIAGTAVAANLPAHIPQRMTDRARAALRDLGVAVAIVPQSVAAAGPGAGIFLVAKYENVAASFSGYGRLGKPSEAVADEAVAHLREHHASDGAVELHLADQLLLPLSLAAGNSTFTTPRPTKHLMTNGWSIGQFAIADISIGQGTPCRVDIQPRRFG
jgi:RNA 3'-terminal phosphate cyclase (ATP)